MRLVENDRWCGRFPLERNIRYRYVVQAWRDPYATWRNEVEKKRAAGQVVRLETIEGTRIARGARVESGEAAHLQDFLRRVEALPEGSEEQTLLLLSDEAASLLTAHAARGNLTRYDRELEVIADRLAARFSAWYEIFPRSQGEPGRHGTFRDVIRQLPAIRDMGFDVLYFPPIHPIGLTNRKGKNNSLKAEPGDVGSVYAIGSEAGGHTATHPDLGTLEDFRAMLEAAEAHGLEIALDFAIQCSPDHPWIGSSGGRTARSASPRTRRRSTRTSSTCTSTGRPCPPCGSNSGTRSCSGCARACASSGWTTRTPSRSPSGSG
jgi:starch synthase (maltosyl-transferring)